MTDNVKENTIELLLRERSELRMENQEREKGIRAIVMAFLTILVGFVVIDKGGVESSDEVSRSKFLFWLAQVEIFCGFMIAVLFINHGVRTGYQRALERRINHLERENLVAWEYITENYLSSKSSLFYRCVVVLFSIGAVLLIYLFLGVASKANSAFYPVIIIVEFTILMVILFSGSRVSDKVEEKAYSKLGSPLDND